MAAIVRTHHRKSVTPCNEAIDCCLTCSRSTTKYKGDNIALLSRLQLIIYEIIKKLLSEEPGDGNGER
jgi:hypothetical protein